MALKDDVCIRKAEASDAGEILSLIRELAQYEKLADRVLATEADLVATLFGSTPAAECLIATVGDEVAGFAIFFHSYSTFLAQPGMYLEDLFVRPRFRAHGLGKRLLKELAKIAVSRRCGRFEWSVLKWNEPAIRFYESLFAERMEGWVTYRLSGEKLAKLSN